MRTSLLTLTAIGGYRPPPHVDTVCPAVERHDALGDTAPRSTASHTVAVYMWKSAGEQFCPRHVDPLTEFSIP